MELSPIAQLYWSTIIAWITKDAKTPIKLKGKPETVKAFAEAAFATKRYFDETKKTDATIQAVMDLLNKKQEAARKFEEQTGYKWPL